MSPSLRERRKKKRIDKKRDLIVRAILNVGYGVWPLANDYAAEQRIVHQERKEVSGITMQVTR